MRHIKRIRHFYLMHKKCVSSEDIPVIFFVTDQWSGVFPERTEQSACCCLGADHSADKQQYPLQTSLCIF